MCLALMNTDVLRTLSNSQDGLNSCGRITISLTNFIKPSILDPLSEAYQRS